jgi:hypothetical protein
VSDLLPSFVRLILLLAANPRPARGDFGAARSALVAWFRDRYPAAGVVTPRGELAAHQRGPYADGPAGARLYLVHAAGIVAEITSDAAPKTYRARFPAESASLAVGVALGAISLLEREIDAEGLLDFTKGAHIDRAKLGEYRRALVGEWLGEGSLGMLYAFRVWGKTWLAYDLALSVALGAEGGDFLGWPVEGEGKGVLYVDGEMRPSEIRERCFSLLEGRGCGLPAGLYFLSRMAQPGEPGALLASLATPEGRAQVERAARGCALVILDNARTLGLGGAEENESSQWLAAQEWLLSLKRLGCAVLFVHHAGKGGQQRGTSAREDACDYVLGLHAPELSPGEERASGARCVVRFEKSRGATLAGLGARDARLLPGERGGVVWGWDPVEEGLSNAPPQPKPPKGAHIDRAKLGEYRRMLGEGLSTYAAAKAVGVPRTTLQRWNGSVGYESKARPVKTPANPDFPSADRRPCLASGCSEEAHRLRIWTGQGQEIATAPHGPYCQDHEEGRVEEWDYCGHGKRPACDRWAVRPPGFAGAVFCRLHGGADYELGSHAERARAGWLLSFLSYFDSAPKWGRNSAAASSALLHGVSHYVFAPHGYSLFYYAAHLFIQVYIVSTSRGAYPDQVREIVRGVTGDLSVHGPLLFASYQEGAALVAARLLAASKEWSDTSGQGQAQLALHTLWSFFVQFGGVDPSRGADKGGES